MKRGIMDELRGRFTKNQRGQALQEFQRRFRVNTDLQVPDLGLAKLLNSLSPISEGPVPEICASGHGPDRIMSPSLMVPFVAS